MVAIIDYDAGNVRSLQFALERLGVASVITADPKEIQAAEKVIFPGQGAAASAMKKLKQTGLDLLIPQGSAWACNYFVIPPKKER